MITVIGSLKGGSGKSTTSFNLAIWLLAKGRNAAIYDLDPQQTLSDAAEFRREDGYEPEVVAITPDNIKGSIYDDLLEADKLFDDVLVDIGNSDSQAAEQAFNAAHRIVIPILPSQSDVWSLQRFLSYIDGLKSCRTDLNIAGFINRADTNQAVRETAETREAVESLEGISLLAPQLGQRTSFRRSFSEGLSVFELDIKSKAAQEFMVLAKSL